MRRFLGLLYGVCINEVKDQFIDSTATVDTKDIHIATDRSPASGSSMLQSVTNVECVGCFDWKLQLTSPVSKSIEKLGVSLAFLLRLLALTGAELNSSSSSSTSGSTSSSLKIEMDHK